MLASKRKSISELLTSPLKLFSPREPTVTFHVGMPKCASTSIQHYFTEQRDAHLARGLCYPRSFCNKVGQGHPNHRPLILVPGEKIDQALEDILKEARDANVSRIFLSCEAALSDGRNKPQLNLLLRSLQDRIGSKNLKLLAFVRNPFTLAESSFAQFLRAGLLNVDMTEFFNPQEHEVAASEGISRFIDLYEQKNGFDFFHYEKILTDLHTRAPEVQLDIQALTHRSLTDLCKMLKVPAPKTPPYFYTRLNTRSLLILHEARRQRRGRNINPFMDPLMDLAKAAGSQTGFNPLLHLSEENIRQISNAAAQDKRWFADKAARKNSLIKPPATLPQDFFTPPAADRFNARISAGLSDTDRAAITQILTQ